MMPDSLFVGQPIRNVQSYLRRIAYEYEEIPLVIPDGIFGNRTKQSVTAFQKKFSMPQTGNIDNATWDRILAVYCEIVERDMLPRQMRVFFYPGTRILPGEANDYLYPIQSVMLLLSKWFGNLGTIELTGINDAMTTAMVKKLQQIFTMEPDGVIDKKFWNRLAGLYEMHIGVNNGMEKDFRQQENRMCSLRMERSVPYACEEKQREQK